MAAKGRKIKVGVEKVVKTNKYFFCFFVMLVGVLFAAGAVVLNYFQWPSLGEEVTLLDVLNWLIEFVRGEESLLDYLGVDLLKTIMVLLFAITSAILLIGYLIVVILSVRRKFFQPIALIFYLLVQIALNAFFISFPFFCNYLDTLETLPNGFFLITTYIEIGLTVLYNVGFVLIYSFYVKHLNHINRLAAEPWTAARRGIKNLITSKAEASRQKELAEKIIHSENRKKAKIQSSAGKYVKYKHREEIKVQKQLDKELKKKQRSLYNYYELKKEVNNAILRADKERISAEKAAYLAQKLAQTAQVKADKQAKKTKQDALLLVTRTKEECRVTIEALKKELDEKNVLNAKQNEELIRQKVDEALKEAEGHLDPQIISKNKQTAKITAETKYHAARNTYKLKVKDLKNLEAFQEQQLRIENERLETERKRLEAVEAANELTKQKLELDEQARKDKENLRREELRAAQDRLVYEVNLKNQESAEWIRNSILEEERERNRAIEAAQELANVRLDLIAKRKEAEAKQKQEELDLIESVNEKESLRLTERMAENDALNREARKQIFATFKPVEVEKREETERENERQKDLATIDDLTKQIEELKNKLKESTMNEEQLQKQIETLNYQLEINRNSNGNVNLEVEQLRRQVSDTSRDLNEAKYDAEKMQRDLAEKEKLINDLKIQLEKKPTQTVVQTTSNVNPVDTEEYRNLQRKLNDFQDDVERYQRKINDLNGELDVKNKRITDLEQNAGKVSNIPVEDTEQYRSLQRKNRDNEDIIEQKDRKIASLEKDLDEMSKSSGDRYSAKYRDLEKEYEEATEDYEKNKRLQQRRIEELEEEIRNFKNNPPPMMDDSERIRREREMQEAINNERMKAQNAINEANNKIAQLSAYANPQRVRTLENRVQVLTTQSQRYAYERQNILIQHRNALNEIQRLRNQASYAPRELANLRSVNGNLSRDNTTLKSKVEALQDQLSELQDENEELKYSEGSSGSVKRLKRQIEQLEAERDEALDEAEELRSKGGTGNSKELKKLQIENSNLNDENESINSENEDLRRKLSVAEKRIKELLNGNDEQNEELNNQIRKLKAQQEALAQEQREAEEQRIRDEQRIREEERRKALEEQEQRDAERKKELEEQQRLLEEERQRALEQQRLLKEERQKALEQQQKQLQEERERALEKQKEIDEEKAKAAEKQKKLDDELRRLEKERQKELDDQRKKLEASERERILKAEKERLRLEAEKERLEKERLEAEAKRKAEEEARLILEKEAKLKAEKEAAEAAAEATAAAIQTIEVESKEDIALEEVANAQKDDLIKLASTLGFNVKALPLTENPHNVFYITQRKEDGKWQIKPPKVTTPVALFKKANDAIICGAITSLVWGGKCYAQNENRKFIAFSSIRDLLEKKQNSR